MMNCETCNDKLADFLLDELPESEAVLVHEHLNLCEECMRKYKELKGTGKSLEAVPALQAVHGSNEFRESVRNGAYAELAVLIDRLPPDKRLRLEARRAARMSQALERQAQPRPSIWNTWMLAGVAVGVVVLALIVFNPFARGAQKQHLGDLSLAIGKVEQFLQRENEPRTPVKAGQAVKRGDAYSTAEGSRALFKIEGQDVFLGPSTDLTFRPGSSEGVSINFENGDLGLQLGRIIGDPTVAPPDWEIVTEAGTLTPSSNAHFYVHVTRGSDSAAELTVISGSVLVNRKRASDSALVEKGCKLVYSASVPKLQIETIPTLRVPAWRTALVSEAELALIVGGALKIKSRTDKDVEVEISYSSESARKALADWKPDGGGLEIYTRNGALALPAERMAHTIPFAAPLQIELTVNRDSLREASFSFGGLKRSDSGVAVDIGARDAVVQIREKDKPLRKNNVPGIAQKGAPEKLRLEIQRESNFFAVQLHANANKSNAMPLTREAGTPSGELWLQGFGEGVLLDDIKLTGVLPTAWLQERLVK